MYGCVNALNGLLLISSDYRKRDAKKTDGVNALNGLLLISSPDERRHFEASICVNALNGLLLISSRSCEGNKAGSTWCQCPQRASTYFFEDMTESVRTAILCQCPQRASTYFFETLLKGQAYIDKCVNALNGLLLISSTIKKFDTFVSRNVSMPSTGFYLFLRTSKFVLLMLVMCQCPQRASTYFF